MEEQLKNPKREISCYFCEREIQGLTHLQCKVSLLNICVDCFANGKETKKHKKTHGYQIIQNLQFSLIDPQWTAQEELLFLHGLEIYGYGNWHDISKNIRTKNDEEVEKHWEYCYKDFLQKIDWKQRLKKTKENLSNKNFQTTIKMKVKILEKQIKQAVQYAQDQGFDLSCKSNSIYGDVLGFMPLRQEFDVEYDNEAELLLAEMEYLEEDTQEEIKIKNNILEIYHKRLEEREKRKKIVIDNNLLNLKKQIEDMKNLTKEQKSILLQLKPYQRYMDDNEFDELKTLLFEELEIKKKIEEFNYLKEKGGFSGSQIEKVLYKEDFLEKTFPNLYNFKPQNKNESYQYIHNLTRQVNDQNGMEFENEDLQPDEFCSYELKLCNENNLNIDDYILMKELLIRKSLQKGYVDRQEFQNEVNFKDKNLLEKIMDLHENFEIVSFKKQIIFNNVYKNNLSIISSLKFKYISLTLRGKNETISISITNSFYNYIQNF